LKAAPREPVPAWLAFFEPDERVTPRLGVAVAPSAVAARMRRAVGLTPDPGVLIVGQPTRGVDVGAIEFIHGQLVAERDKGRAVLLVSAELTEILALSDRVLVMYEGRVIAEVPGAEATETSLGLLMAGVVGAAA